MWESQQYRISANYKTDAVRGTDTVLFKEINSIEEAYLARCSIRHDTAEEAVILALRSASEVDEAIVERIQRVFASIFVKQEHLDILLMDANQERQVASVCLPFYQSVKGAQ